jgi:hypothetical protein
MPQFPRDAVLSTLPRPGRPKPNDRFYRLIVRTGLALRRLFRIRVLITAHTAGGGRRAAGGR